MKDNYTRKQICFDSLKQLKVGDSISKAEMVEYIHALNNYGNRIMCEFIEISFEQYGHFILSEIPMEHWRNSIPKKRLKQFLKKLSIFIQQYHRSNWYPPILYDSIRDKVLDGHHRIATFQKMGHTKIMGFVGVLDPGYNDLKHSENFNRLQKLQKDFDLIRNKS